MKKDAYYTSGQFAKKAHVTLRAIRYYDKQNILKPSARTAAGARLYTDADLAKLQQILLLKYLGFSLEDIREMTLACGRPAVSSRIHADTEEAVAAENGRNAGDG